MEQSAICQPASSFRLQAPRALQALQTKLLGGASAGDELAVDFAPQAQVKCLDQPEHILWDAVLVRGTQLRDEDEESTSGSESSTDGSDAERGRLVDYERPAELSSSGLVGLAPRAGDVDFIAPVECLKKLFRMPYDAKARISLAVHRIGKTIFLEAGEAPPEDDDALSFLEAAAELHAGAASRPEADDERLLRMVRRKRRERARVWERRLFGRLLRGSAAGGEEGRLLAPAAEGREAGPGAVSGPAASGLPRPPKQFRRTVLWKFEDFSLLLGSDLVVLGGEEHPAVGLVLRDKPLTRLACLEYWLENTLADVPELAICFHHEGTVQGYTVVRTADLPTLIPSAPFEGRAVGEHAAGVLRWLKASVRREPGTYLLHKAAHERHLRLYDLTHLLYRPPRSPGQPPRTGSPPAGGPAGAGAAAEAQAAAKLRAPLGMLAFRMAVQSLGREGRAERERRRELLVRAVELIDERQYGALAAGALELLADTFLPPAFVSPFRPPPPAAAAPKAEAGEEEGGDWGKAAAYYERALRALGRTAVGSEGQRSARDGKLRALRMACGEAYYNLSHAALAAGSRGAAMRMAELASQFAELPGAGGAADDGAGRFLAALLSHAGDLYARLPCEPPAALERVRQALGEPAVLFGSRGAEGGEGGGEAAAGPSHLVSFKRPVTLEAEENLQLAIGLYLRALRHLPPALDPPLLRATTRRLGAARNELGRVYEGRGQLTRAGELYQAAVPLFRSVGDVENQALCHANLARLHLLRGQQLPARPAAHELYARAARHYGDALACLPPDPAHAGVRDELRGGLANAHLLLAAALLNRPPGPAPAPAPPDLPRRPAAFRAPMPGDGPGAEGEEGTPEELLAKALQLYEEAGRPQQAAAAACQLARLHAARVSAACAGPAAAGPHGACPARQAAGLYRRALQLLGPQHADAPRAALALAAALRDSPHGPRTARLAAALDALLAVAAGPAGPAAEGAEGAGEARELVRELLRELAAGGGTGAAAYREAYRAALRWEGGDVRGLLRAVRDASAALSATPP